MVIGSIRLADMKRGEWDEAESGNDCRKLCR